jgi:hypothetical protein
LGTEVVEAKAVVRFVHACSQGCFKLDVLRRVELTLEDGVLDTLAPVRTGFGDTAEATLAAIIAGFDIVCDQHMHDYLQMNAG